MRKSLFTFIAISCLSGANSVTSARLDKQLEIADLPRLNQVSNLRKRRTSASDIEETDSGFDLSDCDLYDFDCVLEIHHSYVYDQCRCEDAKRRKEHGEIICEVGTTTTCPDECPICDYCMKELGCMH